MHRFILAAIASLLAMAGIWGAVQHGMIKSGTYNGTILCGTFTVDGNVALIDGKAYPLTVPGHNLTLITGRAAVWGLASGHYDVCSPIP